MNLKNLNEDQIHSEAPIIAGNVRKETTKLLHYINEIEARKIFAKRGFRSLFHYCVEWLKMSEPQAARHVNAARELKEFPELKEKLESGALCLTVVSQVRSALKNKEEKREAFKKLEGKSTREVEKILGKKQEDPELTADLERLKEIWGISDQTELLKKMAKICLKQCDPFEKAKRAKKKPTPAPESKTRYNPAQVRHEVQLRDQGECTYIDKITKRKCGSRFNLEYDHIIPYAHGGKSTIENLRLRCFHHNQLYASEVFGPHRRTPS